MSRTLERRLKAALVFLRQSQESKGSLSLGGIVWQSGTKGSLSLGGGVWQSQKPKGGMGGEKAKIKRCRKGVESTATPKVCPRASSGVSCIHIQPHATIPSASLN